MNITYRTLRYFVAAFEHSSISKAGEALRISPSAISAAIDVLEQEFKLKLVLRHRAKGLQSTAPGKLVFSRAKHLLEELDTFVRDGAELSQSLSGNLHVGYFAPIAPAFLPRIVKPIIKRHPAVTMRFTECNAEQAQEGLLNGDFDVVIFVSYGVHPEIHFEVLLEIPPYLLLPAGHRLAKRNSLSLNEIGDEPFALLDLPVTRDYYRAILKGAGVEPKVILRASTTEMVRSLVASGLACSILNMRPFINLTYSGSRVVGRPLTDKAPPIQLVLGRLHENPRRLVGLFADHCRAYFSSADARSNIVAAEEST